MVVVGLQGAHTGSGRHGLYLLRVPCPGSRSAHSTGTSYLLSAQVPWLVQERVTCNRQREALLFLLLCVCVCVCVRVCECVRIHVCVCVLRILCMSVLGVLKLCVFKVHCCFYTG